MYTKIIDCSYLELDKEATASTTDSTSTEYERHGHLERLRLLTCTPNRPAWTGAAVAE